VSEKLQAPRGTFDVLPEDWPARRRVEAVSQGVLEAAGYRRIETPTFEATELFARGVGESTDIVQKEMYTFADAGGRSQTLRPEGTAPVARAYLEHGMHTLAQPVKLWYLSSFFRQEKPQAGRYRQFWQVGAEVIGSADPAVDAELIVLLHTILDEVGAREVRLRLSSLGSPEARVDYRRALQEHLRQHEDELSGEVRARIDLNPLRAFDSDHPRTQRVMESAPRLLDHLSDEDAAHFEAVKALLEAAGIAYDIDTTLVRGMDYYTRTVFEFESKALGAQSGVGGGGRYDGLIEMIGGPPTPGNGWAAGVERILLAAEGGPEPQPVVDLYVASAKDNGQQAAFALASEARRAGLAVQQELAGRSMKGQLKQADRIGARYVAILGDEGISLKDMESGEQEVVESASAAVARALKGRHTA
jgi:histidyl-tRNA synthetase